MIPSIISSNQKTLINFRDKIINSGNYNLILNGKTKIPVSFNYNRAESIMLFLNKNQIVNIFSDQNLDFIKLNKNNIIKKYQENEKGNNLPYFFILSAIILLIIELILLRIWKIWNILL